MLTPFLHRGFRTSRNVNMQSLNKEVLWTFGPRTLGLALAVCCAAILVSLTRLAIGSRRPKNFPPGPPGLPVLGTHPDRCAILCQVMTESPQAICTKSRQQSHSSSTKIHPVASFAAETESQIPRAKQKIWTSRGPQVRPSERCRAEPLRARERVRPLSACFEVWPLTRRL